MQKDFDSWNKNKKIIHENGESKLYLGFLDKDIFNKITKTIKINL
ncbi:MAG: hypothetical protein WCW46_01190 [Candidatus Paceibacterota bacterium]|jgi:hypothetical protein